jgi:hypothetical protein
MKTTDLNRRRLFNIQLLALLSTLIFLVPCISCNIPPITVSPTTESCSYKIFTLSNDDIRFKLDGYIFQEHPLYSFEYPGCYDLVKGPGTDFGKRVTVTMFTRDGQGELKKITDKSMINVRVMDLGQLNPLATIDDLISRQTSDQTFKVLERKSIEVNGIQAEYYAFRYTQAAVPFNYTTVPSYEVLVRFACMDYKGFRWEIVFNGFEEEDQETSIYYQHLLDTFKILDYITLNNAF